MSPFGGGRGRRKTSSFRAVQKCSDARLKRNAAGHSAL